MAGSVTVTTTELPGGITKYSIAWLSDAIGAVSGNAVALKAGTQLQAGFTPDAAGTQPTDAYDATMTDTNGVDILGGTGANLSNATATVAVPAVSTYFRRYLEAGNYTPVIANAGNAKGGTIVLLVQS
ncbi:MAG: hypothetical protein AB7G21_08565 [Dehalococcoidia bacterium]